LAYGARTENSRFKLNATCRSVPSFEPLCKKEGGEEEEEGAFVSKF
jgi:hypothetical protein